MRLARVLRAAKQSRLGAGVMNLRRCFSSSSSSSSESDSHERQRWWLDRLGRRFALRSERDEEAHRPELIFQPGSKLWEEDVLPYCDLLQQSYFSPWPGHIQTLLATLIRQRPKLDLQREILAMSDGGQLALDWFDRPAEVDGDRGFSFDSPHRPTLIVFPGLTGGSHSKYVRHTAQCASQVLGIRVVIFNYRGHSAPLTSLMPTTAADVSDFVEVIHRVHERHPESPLLGIGFSMGANMLVKAMGGADDRRALRSMRAADKAAAAKAEAEIAAAAEAEAAQGAPTVGVPRCSVPEPLPFDEPLPLKAGISISNPFDFGKLSQTLRKPINSVLFSRPLAFFMKRHMLTKSNISVFQQAGVNVKPLLQAKTLWDLDDRYSKYVYGFERVEEYYDKSSSYPFVRRVPMPLFCLNAIDDPFLPGGKDCVPLDAFRENPRALIALTRRGGHIGWGLRERPTDGWMVNVIMQVLQRFIHVTTTTTTANKS